MQAALDAGARIVNDISGLAHRSGLPLGAGRARRLPGGADAHARHARHDARPRRLRRRGRGGRGRTGRPPRRRRSARASRRNASSLDPGIGFAKIRRAEPGTAARPAGAAPPGPAAAGGRVAQSASSAASPACRNRAGGWPVPSPPACSRCRSGASILRVHDVAETVQALRMWQALWPDDAAGRIAVMDRS